MAADRTARLHRKLAALAAASPDQPTYAQGTCDLLVAAVGADFACLATTDPATCLITGSVKSRPGDAMDGGLRAVRVRT